MCMQLKLKQVTQEIVSSALKIMAQSVYKIILYGSYARGDNTAESDIDIMIILDCSKTDVKQYKKRLLEETSRIGLENDMLLSVLLRDRQEFADKQNMYPFYQNIMKEGIELYGRAA